jgi:hypothetical protein
MAGAGFKTWVDGDILTAGDVNTYLMDQAVMVFADAAARSSAITSPTEGMVTFLKDNNLFQVYDGSAWVMMRFGLEGIIRYTTSSTFTKATYPWLRAIRVYLVGGGGGGGGAGTTTAGQAYSCESGGGGGYAESFITDIASLDASITITVGAGGNGGTGAAAGTNGGASSFGALVAANGGNAGGYFLATGPFMGASFSGGVGTAGDIQIQGGSCRPTTLISVAANASSSCGGGDSLLGFGAAGSRANGDGNAGQDYGGGGSGAAQAENQGTARNGGAGAPGIVIVELYS